MPELVRAASLAVINRGGPDGTFSSRLRGGHMKKQNGKSHAAKTRDSLDAKRKEQLNTTRQVLKLAFYHLNAARFLLLSHRIHLETS
jgi:hypothetical protein